MTGGLGSAHNHAPAPFPSLNARASLTAPPYQETGKAGRFFALWGRIAHRFAWPIAVLAVVSAVGAGIYAARTVKINSDTADMLSAELDFRQLNIELRGTFPKQARDLVVVIDGATPEQAERAAARMRAEIARRPDLFRSVFHPQGDPFFRRNGLLLLPIEELEDTADRILAAQPFIGTVWQDRSIRGVAEMLSLAVEKRVEEGGGKRASTVSRPRWTALPPLSCGSPEGAGRAVLDEPDVGPGDDRRSGRRQILLVEIALAFDRFRPGREAIGAIREIAASMPAELSEGVDVRLTGRAALRHDELQSVRGGMELAGALSFGLVSLLLLLCFRSIRISLAALLTLVVGLVWTAAFAAAAVGVLNLISVAFAVLFIGLCVDFGIHYGLRWARAARIGLEGGAANALAAASVGPGLRSPGSRRGSGSSPSCRPLIWDSPSSA